MYCPGCGIENGAENARFCRSCGADLRAVSRAMRQSLPVKLASTVDAYLENRYQQNLRTGVVNIIAFVALLAVGSGHMAFGWTKLGLFMLGLSALSLIFGAWDIWIYRRNLPPIADRSVPGPSAARDELDSPHVAIQPPLSIAEPTTRKLDLSNRENR